MANQAGGGSGNALGQRTERGRVALPPQPQSELDQLMGTLFGSPGDQSAYRDAISGSYDSQIDIYGNLLGEMGGLNQAMIDTIYGSAGSVNSQIGGFYGSAAGDAAAGQGAVGSAYGQASGNVDAIYDTLAQNLGGVSGQTVDAASSAAGDAVGGSIAGRVDAAVAPFQEAGESARASTKTNLSDHSSAASAYLSGVGAAAGPTAAQRQGDVSARAQMAALDAQVAMAQQRSEIGMKMAQLEGAKQMALLEHSADMSGSTFQRLMDTSQLFNSLGADDSILMEGLGLEAGVGSEDYEDSLRLQLLEKEHADAFAPEDPYDVGGHQGFDMVLEGADPSTQSVGRALRDYAEVNALEPADLLGLLQTRPGDPTTRLPAGAGTRTQGSEDMQALLEELLGEPFSFDANRLREAFRVAYE